MSEETIKTNELVFNGLDMTTGGYIVPPVTPDELRDHAYELQQNNINFWKDEDSLNDLRIRDLKAQNSYDLNRDVPPDRIDRAGWGLIFPEKAPKQQVDRILEALSDLVNLRKSQAGELYKLYYGDGKGYQPGESGVAFAQRHGLGPGSVNPKIMPYYLLIVADPASIPFSFQYQLDVQFGVGRIYFENLDDYAHYARSVWTAEQKPVQVALDRKAVFFGVANPDDQATQLSAKMMIDPLFQYVDDKTGACHDLGWSAEHPAAADSKKNALLRYLGGEKTPALLFTATHGAGWPNGHLNQKPFQGALVCQDWPGPKEWKNKEMPRDFYVGAEDIDSSANLLGTVAFLFACYGAGTPDLDDYSMAMKEARKRLAARPFLSALPLKMLSHPRGGALAVVGHVERAWGYSFNWDIPNAEPESMKNFLFETMRGIPVGYAMESMNTRYGQIATAFSKELEHNLKWNREFDSHIIARLWMFNNDARAYAVLGDPAVRIPAVEQGADGKARPAVQGAVLKGGRMPEILSTVTQDEFGKHYDVPTAVEQPASAGGEQGGGRCEAGGEGRKGGSGGGSGGGAGERQVAYAISPIEGLARAVNMYEVEPVSFGIGEEIQNRIGPVVQGLFTALQQTTDKLKDAAERAATLKVSTGVVENLNTFDPQRPQPGQVDQRFVTTISLTGDTQLYLSSRAAASDEVLLELHKEMVAQAFHNRMEMMRTLADMITSLFGSGK